MSFEIGNTAAEKDPSTLSHTANAQRMRKRHAAKMVAAEAERRRVAAAKAAKREAMIAQFGEDRVLAWESLRIAGVIVFDLLNFFFGHWPEKEIVTTDENVEESIDSLARALEGCAPDSELPPTEWDKFREYAGYARRLGFDVDITPANCREFFGYYLKVRRGEIVDDPTKPYPWRQQAPAPVVAETPAPEPMQAKPEWTTPMEPPAPTPTIPVDLHDALTAFWAAQRQ